MKKAFTLVEILIVTAILGIMAAIVMPLFADQVQLAKEAAAKDNLRVLRGAIEHYAAQHMEVPPGYQWGNPSSAPGQLWLMYQLIYYKTNAKGHIDGSGPGSFPYGPYLKEIPANPFNGSTEVNVLADATEVPDTAPGTHGWVYHPATKTFKLDCTGSDSEGVSFWDY